MSVTLYGIWLFDEKSTDQKTEAGSWWMADDIDEAARLTFIDEQRAQYVAAKNYGYIDYANCLADGWCEVRPLNPPTVLEGAAGELLEACHEAINALMLNPESCQDEINVSMGIIRAAIARAEGNMS